MDLTLNSSSLALRDVPLAQLQQIAWNHANWTADEALRFDQMLRGRVLDLLRDEADPEPLAAAATLLGTMVRPSLRPALDAFDLRYASRWRAWSDLVATRAVQVRDVSPEIVRDRKHAGDALRALEAGPMKQIELATKLKLDPSALSRLLAVLEDADLVIRTKNGREKLVSLPTVVEAAEGRPGLRVWAA